MWISFSFVILRPPRSTRRDTPFRYTTPFPSGLQGPDLHLAEALAAELRLAAQRLLGDQAVGADGAGVDLVVDQVVQLQHVDVADRDLAVEDLAAAPVRSEEHTSELQSLMRSSYDAFCLQKKKKYNIYIQ